MAHRKRKCLTFKILTCRLELSHVRYIEKKADMQGHGNVSRVLRQLIDRDRGAA